MVNLSQLLLLVLSVVFIVHSTSPTYSPAEIEHHYYVHPDEDSSSCPDSSNHTCWNLTFYAENKEEYFKSNTTFEFLDGVFCLNTNLSIEDISDLTFIGRVDNSTIDCSGYDNAGFAFINVTNLNIENLAFRYCGQESLIHYDTVQSDVRAALLSSYGSNHFYTNVQVLYSRDQNIYYNNVEGEITVRNSTFAHAADYTFKAGNSFFFSECNGVSTELCIENTHFINNSNRHGEDQTRFAAGLLIVLKCTTVNVTLESVKLHQNEGSHGGNLAVVLHDITHWFTSHVHIQNSVIKDGKANIGGGLFISFVEESIPIPSAGMNLSNSRTIVLINNVEFNGNVATQSGGALYLRQKESQTYYSAASTKIENCKFKTNLIHERGAGGVAIHTITFTTFAYLPHGKPQFQLEIVNSTFSKHHVKKHSGKGVIFAKGTSYVSLFNVDIHDNGCSGILGISSNFVFSGDVNIFNNIGSSGGGILFCSDSVMFLKPYTTLTITNNHAEHAGGGICIDQECLQSKPMCFFQLDEQASIQEDLMDTIQVDLINNTATYAGDGLYGGSVVYCYLLDPPIHNVTANTSKNVFKKIFTIKPKHPSYITSTPQQVCMCNQTHRCNLRLYPIWKYPGETFPLHVLTVGQLHGIVPGTILASLKKDKGYVHQLGENEEVQKTIGKDCAVLNYTIYTNSTTAELILTAQIIGDASFVEHLDYYTPLKITVQLRDCPVGFKLARDGAKKDRYLCDCNLVEILRHRSDMTCNITDQTLTRNRQFWIGYDNETHTYLYSNAIILDYCLPNETIDIKVYNDSMEQDVQCNEKRTGILCGACVDGYSVILGSSECRKDCSNNHLLLLMFFIVVGILLVFLLTFLNLTVAEGTMSGLIFYANIVQVHRNVFFQEPHIHIFTSSLLAFVSWINLDFGIPMCLYHGMTEYDKAWFQFFFPVYIWMISGLVVYLSRRFDSFARVFGENGVKVLATLILLSYSKMLRAAIEAIHFQIIYHYSYDTDETLSVLHWKQDANLIYLQGKHIPLFTTGLFLLLISTPFTLILLCIQNLQKMSNRQGFTWVWRLKPFFDAYTGPFTKHARFWTGFLLLTRVVLLIISATNYSGIETTNIYFTIIACTTLFVVEWALRPGIYEKRVLDILECSFLINLCLLCTGTAYISVQNRHDGQRAAENFQHIISHGSASIAFLTFIGIVVYHGYIKVVTYLKKRRQAAGIREEQTTTVTVTEVNVNDNSHHVHNTLGNFPPVVRFNEDREPLLASQSVEDEN